MFKQYAEQFPFADRRTFEPKVLVPFEHVRGRVPRRIEVERRRRVYELQDTLELLRLAGLSLEEVVQRNKDRLPIEVFDDSSYETRNPAEWLQLMQSAEHPQGKYLPAEALRSIKTSTATTTYDMQLCRVTAWNTETNQLRVAWGPQAMSNDEVSEWVPRILVHFLADDPILFAQRIRKAHELRMEATNWIRYRLCADSMPTDGLPAIEPAILQRVSQLGSGIPQLSRQAFPDVDRCMLKLVDSLTLEWKRTHNRILLQRRLDSDAQLSDLVKRVSNLSVTDVKAGPFPDRDADVARKDDAALVTAGYDFGVMNQQFTFATYYTQPEVVSALTAVRAMCIKAVSGCLFNLPKERHMSLEAFRSMQLESMDRMATYLKTEWKEELCVRIRDAFTSVGKGWLNVNEQDQGIYEVSKLRKLFVTIRYMMEDTLFGLVYKSLQAFVDFFNEVSAFDVKVLDMTTVTTKPRGAGGDEGEEKQPLFTVELIERNGEFSYSTPPDQFEDIIVDLFDRAITVTQAVPQVEKFVLTQYFWSKSDGDGPYLETVKRDEERVCALRDAVRSCMHESLSPLKQYLDTYAVPEFLDMVRLDKQQYIEDTLRKPDVTMEDMKEQIKAWIQKKRKVTQRVPHHVTVGNFVVDCHNFGYAMANKNQELAKVVMDEIGAKAKAASKSIRDQFTKMAQTFAAKPGTVEKLAEVRAFIAALPETVALLSANIEDMKQSYIVLESFQYGLTDEEFRHKWEAIGWPRRLEGILDLFQKQLDSADEELRVKLAQDREKFSSDVERVQRTVATFTKHTDSSKYGEVVAIVKNLKKEIEHSVETSRDFNNKQRLLGEEVTDYRMVTDLEKEFKPYFDLWTTAQLWFDNHQRWHRDVPFDKLEPEEIDFVVNQSNKVMTGLAKVFKDKQHMLKIVEEVKSGVDEFRPRVPIIMSLRNPGMQKRHWDGLSEKLKLDLFPGRTLNTVSDVEPLEPYKEAIVAHCEVAAREYQIEKTLLDCRSKWEKRAFTVEPYKATKTFILKETAEISELLDEHLNIVQQLQFSAFKAFFAEEIDKWEKELNLTVEILEKWLECQRSWRYLEPIFSSEDIAVQLPKLSKTFENVDKVWRRLMQNSHHNPLVMHCCLSNPKLLDQLKDCNRNLEVVQKGLNDYLQEKRQTFARFYFLSDEELLEILSQSKDPRSIDRHMKKLFEFMDSMEWMPNNEMVAFCSSEKERVPHTKPLAPKGNVENWLNDVQSMMKESIAAQVKLAVADYVVQSSLRTWLLTWPGQVVIAVAQVFWTKACEDTLAAESNVKSFALKLHDRLMELVDIVQSPLKAVERINMGSLITIEVHAKDTIDNMARDKVSSATAFDWIKQLRFYFESDNLCHIRQVDAHFIYGGEYLGNTGRLVVTPLTDRIYLTLTGALALCLGGAPAGPAGTGKTETTKDLAKALAKQCVVFNCQEGMTFKSMGKFFKGLAWSGAWACFDEFNRIDIEVLSVVAQQVTDLQQACITKAYAIDNFEGSAIVVDPTYAVFITMNPGYAGRTELPDNLKVLFRPVACMVPDYALIGEIRLFSYGYRKARVLAQKMVMTFKLSSEQLSSQDHYDFGMRAVNTVISAAGLNKREMPTGDEDLLLLRALRDSNVPKFLVEDIGLFEGIISDLFPGAQLPATEYGALTTTLKECIIANKLQPVEEFILKALQLYDITVLRHGLMMVGPTGGGKTSAMKMLQAAMTSINVKQSKGQLADFKAIQKVQTHICNPKAITMDQLYGAYDKNTGEWADGILCILFRGAASPEDPKFKDDKQWVVFDGPVDALWIESMNTVLDENKKLCLVSGEIIQMSKAMTMMFEVEDLSVASPATVSRCGMIYLEPESCVPTAARVKSWGLSFPAYFQPFEADVAALSLKYLDPLVTFVRRNLKEYVPSVDNNLVVSFFNMFNGYIATHLPPPVPAGTPTAPERIELMKRTLCPLFFFSLVWSVGASCDEKGRTLFDQKLRAMMVENGHGEVLPPEESVYDWYYHFSPNPEDEVEPVWTAWEETKPAFSLKAKLPYFDIIVPTIDSIRQNYVLTHLMSRGCNVAAVGPTGTGKSVSVNEIVQRGLPEKFMGLMFTFSAQTSANVLQDSLMSKFDKRRAYVFGAPAGKHFICFIDDTNLPQKQQYGAQPPIELLRQVLGHGGFYTYLKPISFNKIIDVSLALAMGPPGGGRNSITNRFMRYFNLVSFPNLSDKSMTKIFRSILDTGFQLQKLDSLMERSQPLVEATLSIFHKCSKAFVPKPAHVHYTFNMRDISRVFACVYESDGRVLKDKHVVTRLWVHECLRVFGDRLVSDQDSSTLKDFLHEELIEKLQYDGGYDQLIRCPRLIFGDYMNPHADRRVYDEISDLDSLGLRMNDYLAQYNEEVQPQMNLVMFLDAIEHVSRIVRVLRMPNGHALLLGMGGSGRKSMTRLACSIVEGMELFTVEVTKSFGIKEWREAISKMLLGCGREDKKITFLFNDTQIVRSEFLEDVASLLTSGEVPNIFDEKQIEQINEKFKDICVAEGRPATKLAMYTRFIKEVRNNLHIVIAFSPIGETFRSRMRNFPALVNCCTIDWFAEWPKDALLSVALAEVESSDTDLGSQEARMNICQAFTRLHSSAWHMTEKYFNETRRRSYITPTSYLALLQTFMRLLREKREFVFKQKARLESGLDKLKLTEDRVADLQEQLKAKQPILKKTQEEIKGLMVKLAADREVAAEKQAVAQREEREAAGKADACAKLKKACEDRLGEAEPMLVAAVKSVKKITSAQINEIQTIKVPPKGATITMDVVGMLLFFGECPREFITGSIGQKEANWMLAVRSKLKYPNAFLEELTEGYQKEQLTENLVRKVEQKIRDREKELDVRFEPADIAGSASVPVSYLCMWAHAMIKWFYVNKEVQPLREQLTQAQAELAVVMEQLTDTRAKLKAVEDNVAMLQKQYDKAVAEQTALEKEVEVTSQKLSRAERLINGLKDEKVRWKELVRSYTAQGATLVGDMLLAASTIAYFGPLQTVYRRDLHQEGVRTLDALGIAHSDNTEANATLGNPVDVQQWQLDGLPTDALSTENAIIMFKSRSWPLLIDPQMQANSWIRNMHKEDNLQICRASDAKYMKSIEAAVRLGLPCLLENMTDNIDPVMETVLLKQTYLIGTTPHIRVGDSVVPYDNKFRLYMTTKLPNPSYTPEAIVKVALLNFFITPGGLEDQLLGKTVEKERRDLEELKQQLTRSNAEKNRELKNLQDNILVMLQEAEGDILEQEGLINALEASKKKSIEINEDIEKAKITEADIDKTRNAYREHAFRGALLFFCVAAISSIDPMYQFSLQWFMNLFLNGIDKAEKDDDVAKRIAKLKEYFTFSFYNNVCRSLFERHKLMFSFFLCFSIIKEDGKVDDMEFRSLLTGATLTVTPTVPNPASDWLTEQTWNELSFLATTLPNFAGFDTHIAENVAHYKNLFDSGDSHIFPLAAPWNEKATPLQRLIITRCFRMDKVTHGIQSFVRHFIGERFIIPPQFDLMDAYKDSDACTPLIFIISPGSDPMADLLKFADQMRMSKKLDKVSLGQGQEMRAEEMVVDGSNNGSWVLLQNCHLFTSWMPRLEALIEAFDPNLIKKEFRLWLTSMPSGSFPVSVLQIGVKMTKEPPKGLRANVTSSFYAFKEDDIHHVSKPGEFKKLLFAECLFHAVIQERRRFGSLGFNIPYEFNDSDRTVCVSQLRKFLGMYDYVPFDVLKFLFAEINYGGRVTDDWDRRCMLTMICDFIDHKTLDTGYHFSPSGVYKTVEPGNRQYYLSHLESWPINPAPEVFGLHENADITSARNETRSLLTTVLSMMTVGGTGGGASSRDHLLAVTATGIQQRLPAPFNIIDFQEKYPTKYEESMNTVVVQEAVRYNKLLKQMAVDVREFLRALKGEVVMSSDLERMGNSLFINAVPASWEKLAYPSLMPLSSWVDDLVKRCAFIQSWYQDGLPVTFWMGGFFFPQAFLTGTLQNFARKCKEPIDIIKFGFTVLKQKPQDIKERVTKGAVVFGLIVEGARWDTDAGCLAESRPKELYTDLPPIYLEPIVNRVQPADVYRCPVYKTLTRAGTLSTTGHSTNFVLGIDLPTGPVPESHWIKRGVACVLGLNF